MKLVCNRLALLEAMNQIVQIIISRSPKVALHHVKLTAKDGALSIFATDLDRSVEMTVAEVQVSEPGEALVLAIELQGIVRESVNDILSISKTPEGLKIVDQDVETYLYQSDRVSDFPEPARDGFASQLSINTGELRRLIRQTIFAAAQESTRYAFNGVLISTEGRKVTFVGTDGKRLAMAYGASTSDAKNEDAIIPSKTLKLLDQFCGDPELVANFEFGKLKATIRVGSTEIRTNQIGGEFPPYADIFPSEPDKKMTIATADFMSALRRVSLVCAHEAKGIRLDLSSSKCSMRSRSPELGCAKADLECRYEGESIEIGFNPKFLLDVLGVVETDEVTLEMTAPNRPGLLRAGPSFCYLQMPVIW